MDVIEWLEDADPAIRWQVKHDLAGASPEAVAVERARVAVEGWGSRLLQLQDPGGTWDGGTYRPGWVDDSRPFFDAWTATHFTLQLLHLLGLDPASSQAERAVGLVRDRVRWSANGAGYFEGETEPCVNGIALATGAYFGQDVAGILERLVAEQLDDGGWNCWVEYGATVSSFHTTICVLEGLFEWELANGASSEVADLRRRGEEYLLERALFRSVRSGAVVDPRFTMFSFPVYWYYDVLRGLDYLRATGQPMDERCGEAVEMVQAKRRDAGVWALENQHEGATHFRMEGPEGSPSRWITLRAMRVLKWAHAI